MRRKRWTVRAFASALLWLTVAQAESTASLEVVGKITVFAEVEPTAEGQQIVQGRLSDEVGKPVEGTVQVKGARGQPVSALPCPWIEPSESGGIRQRLDKPGLIATGPDGQYCFLTEESKGLALVARAEHFEQATHDLDVGLERALSRPRFVQAPTSVDLFEDTSHVVELLGRSERKPPRGARLALSLACDASHPLGESSLDESRMQRFEFEVPSNLQPGACQFVATVSAPRHEPLRATRSVLTVDRIELDIRSRHDERRFVRLVLGATGHAKKTAPLSEGLVEARENGAFLALSPVQGGRAELELERAHSRREIQLTYVPSSPAYVAGSPISTRVAAIESGFRWATVHTTGLLLFALWLGYAWLRPRRSKQRPDTGVPPKRAVLRSGGGKTGPVAGQTMDAHTGVALGEVKLQLYSVRADSETLLETITSNSDGSFRFETRFEQQPLLKLRASCSDYMPLVSRAKSARLTVHLTHCRRAVVQELVTWARHFGRPYHRTPAATPGSVEQAANSRREYDTAEWARDVAQAAYAPEAPSEQQVERLARPDRRPSEP